MLLAEGYPDDVTDIRSGSRTFRSGLLGLTGHSPLGTDDRWKMRTLGGDYPSQDTVPNNIFPFKGMPAKSLGTDASTIFWRKDVSCSHFAYTKESGVQYSLTRGPQG